MVFFESLQALLSLDLQFFIDFATSQIMWLFMFFVLVYYFFGGKRPIYFYALFLIYLLVFLDIGTLAGLGLGPIGLGIWLMLRVLVEGVAKTNSFVRNNFLFVWLPLAYALILVMTFFWSWSP